MRYQLPIVFLLASCAGCAYVPGTKEYKEREQAELFRAIGMPTNEEIEASQRRYAHLAENGHPAKLPYEVGQEVGNRGGMDRIEEINNDPMCYGTIRMEDYSATENALGVWLTLWLEVENYQPYQAADGKWWMGSQRRQKYLVTVWNGKVESITQHN